MSIKRGAPSFTIRVKTEVDEPLITRTEEVVTRSSGNPGYGAVSGLHGLGQSKSDMDLPNIIPQIADATTEVETQVKGNHYTCI